MEKFSDKRTNANIYQNFSSDRIAMEVIAKVFSEGAIEGRANTDEKKQAIIERLFIVWCQMPDLRLGQLLLNVFRDTPWYYLEDGLLIEQLEAFYKKT